MHQNVAGGRICVDVPIVHVCVCLAVCSVNAITIKNRNTSSKRSEWDMCAWSWICICNVLCTVATLMLFGNAFMLLLL